MGRLDGQVVIVTGAGRGIGRAHALLFASEGAHVVVNALGVHAHADAETVVAEIAAAGGSAVADGSSATWEGSASIVEHALDAFGRLDIVVNNATFQRNDDLWTYPEANWDKTFDVNLKGYFAMIRSAVPHMARQGSVASGSAATRSGRWRAASASTSTTSTRRGGDV